MVFRLILARFSVASVVIILLIYFPLASGLSALSALIIWLLFNASAGSRPDLAAYTFLEVFWSLKSARDDVGVELVTEGPMMTSTKTKNDTNSAANTFTMSGRYDLGPAGISTVERSPLSCRSTNVPPPIYGMPKQREYDAERYSMRTQCTLSTPRAYSIAEFNLGNDLKMSVG